jgi:hypothetical protein
MTTELSDTESSESTVQRDLASPAELKSLLAEAEDIETTPDRLLALAGMHPRLAVAAAGNPATPASRLRHLARSQRISIRAAIAGNPNADLETLKLCIPASPSRFLNNPALPFLLLENPNLLQELPYNAFRAIVLYPAVPQQLLTSLTTEALRSPEERRGGLLLARPDLSAAHAHALCRSILPCTNERLLTHVACVDRNEVDILPTIVRLAMRRSTLEGSVPALRVLARTRALPVRLLEEITAVACTDVLEAIATNIHTPPHLLDRLAQNQEPAVTLALHANPALSEATRKRIEHHAFDMRRLLEGKPTLTDLAQLARHRLLSIRQAVARHPDSPATVCDWFARGRCIALQLLAAKHPNTSEFGLMRLIDSGRSDLIEAVCMRPNLPAAVKRRLLQRKPLTTVVLEDPPTWNRPAVLKTAYPGLDPRSWRPLDSNVLLNPELSVAEIRELLPCMSQDLLIAYAARPHADPELIGRIVQEWAEPKRLDRVAANPATPPEVLAQLARSRYVDVRRQAALNPSLPADCLRPLLEEPACRFNASMHPSLTLEQRRVHTPELAELIHEMVRHPQHMLIRSLLQQPLGDPGYRLQFEPEFSASSIDLIMRCTALPEEFRMGALRHPNASPDTLRRFAESDNLNLVLVVAQHPSTPTDVLEALLRKRGKGAAIARAAACNENLPRHLWAQAEPLILSAWMAQHSSCPFWPMMLSHPACPQTRTLSHARSAIWQNRCMVAMNASTPSHALQRLAHDGLHAVRNAARRTLSQLGLAVLPYDQVDNPLITQGDDDDTI